MIDISIQNIHKYYGDKHILRGVSFSVQSGEHVGLLGPNGAGKTTLFRVVSGAEAYDKSPDPNAPGMIAFAPDKRVGLLSQIPVYPAGTTALEVLREAFAPLEALQAEMDELSRTMADDPARLRRFGELQQLYELREGFTAELRLSRVCAGLNLPDSLTDRPFAELSGGEQTRVNLARLILEETSILLLDEPTNHLDMRSMEWLEGFLAQYKGTVLCISHDRYFLDHCVDRVLELDHGIVTEYSGNYSFYVIEKERRYQEQLKRFQKEEREIKRLSAVARRMHDYAGKNAKLHRAAFSIDKRVERLKTTEKPQKAQVMRGRFQTAAFLADDVLRLRGVGFGYTTETKLIDDLTAAVRPGDRIALLGGNGAGKTTLFKLLTGELVPDEGRILPGPSVKSACLPQVISFDRPDRTLLDTMLYSENCSVQEARDRLGLFHFRGEDVFKTVSALSGGEKSRLKLCQLMGNGVSLLLLDEPTNHLDIASREWMEEAVEGYGQTLMFISHDRYFIGRFATRIWELKDGCVTDFPGGYEEYKAYKAAQEPPPPAAAHTGKKEKAEPPVRPRDAEKAVKRLEKRLAELEAREKSLQDDMDAFATDGGKLSELLEQLNQTQAEWREIFAQWEEVSAR